MLLQQTSEWEGSLWEKPDTADRRRGVDRELENPGTFWEYNDVRVNLLARYLLEVWQKPLPHLDCYRDRFSTGYPVAERACSRILSLPIYPEMPQANRDRVISAIREFFEG